MDWDEMDEINEFIDIALLLKDKIWFNELLEQKKELLYLRKYKLDPNDIYDSKCGWTIFNWNIS